MPAHVRTLPFPVEVNLCITGASQQRLHEYKGLRIPHREWRNGYVNKPDARLSTPLLAGGASVSNIYTGRSSQLLPLFPKPSEFVLAVPRRVDITFLDRPLPASLDIAGRLARAAPRVLRPC